MRRTVSADLVAAVFFGLVGVVFLIATFQIPADVSAASVIGPRVFPTVIGIMLVMFSALLVVQVSRHGVSRDRMAGSVGEVASVDSSRTDASTSGTPPSGVAHEHHLVEDLVGHPIESAAWVEAHAVVEGDRASPRRIVVILALLAAYIFAFIPLGYPLSTFLFLAAITTYLDRSRLIRNLVYAALFSAVVYVVFNYGLRVSLPLGVLG